MGTMPRLRLFTAIIAITCGLVILVFAEGARRWYSGLFLLGMGLLLLLDLRRRQAADTRGITSD